MAGQTKGVIDLAYIYTLGSEFVPRLVGIFCEVMKNWKQSFILPWGIRQNLSRG